MASIGQQLLQPESGWKRYNDDDINFSYYGDWIYNNPGFSHYLGDYHVSKTIGDKVQFNFVGTKIRILATRDSVYYVAGSWDIFIDGIKMGTYSNPRGGSVVECVLLFQISNLISREHSVEIVLTDATGLSQGGNFDAVDIDDTGELRPYNQNLVKEKHLLKSNNKIYTLNKVTNTLEDITLSIVSINNITKLEYETYGFDDLTKLTSTLMNDLVKPVKLLYYRDRIDGTTPKPRFRQEYNLNVGVRQMIKKPVV